MHMVLPKQFRDALRNMQLQKLVVLLVVLICVFAAVVPTFEYFGCDVVGYHTPLIYPFHKAFTGSSVMLKDPSATPYDNLRNCADNDYSHCERRDPNKISYSQCGQDEKLHSILKHTNKGFFVESGSKDGEESSNTLFYEKLGWTGLLVEPDPKWFPYRHRNAYLFKGCLSPTGQEDWLHFRRHGGGLGALVSADQGSPMWMPSWLSLIKTSTFAVNSQPLHELVLATGHKTVDFWSLDIEGVEAAVLDTTDFKKIELGLLLVELNTRDEDKVKFAAIQKIMKREGFRDIGFLGCDPGEDLDRVFINPSYFTSRGLDVPTGPCTVKGCAQHSG